MKTKHILAALAIPAFLAACSSEDEFTLNNTPELAGRKVINTDLAFDFKSRVDTRLSIDGDKIVLDENDKVAAALIDEVQDNSGSQINGYYITTGIATNHPFSKTQTGWNTPTRLVEGNYLFYYQYNEELGGSRKTAVPYSIGKTQYAYTKEAPTVFAGTQAVKDNAMGIGYAFLKAEDGMTSENVEVKMHNLFAFLKFNITTTKSGLEVQQILVKRTNNQKFKLSGIIDNAKVAVEGSKNTNEGKLAINHTSDYATEAGNDDYIILSLPDLKATAVEQTAYVVIPAADYISTNDDNANENLSSEFIIDVYTNQGVFTRTVELSKSGINKDQNISDLTMGKVQPISLKIEGTLNAAEKYFVGSSEQWEKVLKSLPAVDPIDNTALNIEILDEVELTKADIELIETTEAKNYVVNITGESLVLTEDCALKNITIAKVEISNSATVELGNKVAITTLENRGTINIVEAETVADVTTLTNNGVVNVETAVDVETLTNGSDQAKADNSAVALNVNANLTITTFTNHTSENNATVTVENSATLTTGTGTNKGTINNNGTIIANGVFSNTGAVAVINNNTAGVVSNVNGSGKAVKNLEGANIDAAEGSTTIVADNTASTITYKDGANVSVTGAGAAKGKIAYVITNTYLVPTTAVEYNTIVIDGLTIKLNTTAANTTAFNITTAGITNVVLKNGSTVDMSMVNTDTSNSGAVLTLIEIEGNSNKIIAADLTATDLSITGGYLLIPLNSKITATKLDNKGTVNVGGTLVYTASGSTAGTILGTGTVTAN